MNRWIRALLLVVEIGGGFAGLMVALDIISDGSSSSGTLVFASSNRRGLVCPATACESTLVYNRRKLTTPLAR